MKRRTEAFIVMATMLVGAMWLPITSQGAAVQAGFIVAQQVDWRVRMEREAAGYVRAGQQALKQGQLQKARAWFLKAKRLFPNHKGANAGLRQVGVAEAQAKKRAVATAVKRKQWLAGFRNCVPGHGRRKTCTNSIGMKFVLIPAGSFLMGSPSRERNRDTDEYQHRVVISRPFYMQTTEVTQAQYRAIMGRNPGYFKGCDRCPVERVSWHDAREFIRRLNARERTNKYHLPTEAEWEYACRAGTNTPFYFGEAISTGRANYNDENAGGPDGRQGVHRRKTTPVGSFPPNRWGLYDMHGNVREWCQDWYGRGYYSHSPSRDPRGPSSGTNRVLRGGSWDDSPSDLRAAYRAWNDPWNRENYFGFRVARRY